MHATVVEDHGHGAPVGDLPIETGDLCLDQVHEGLTLCAHATATCKDCQRTAGTHSQPQSEQAALDGQYTVGACGMTCCQCQNNCQKVTSH